MPGGMSLTLKGRAEGVTCGRRKKCVFSDLVPETKIQIYDNRAILAFGDHRIHGQFPGEANDEKPKKTSTRGGQLPTRPPGQMSQMALILKARVTGGIRQSY